MDKQKILSSLDIPEFYKSLVPSLKVNGNPEVMALCPFHHDTNPSLSVNIETGLFRCFACDAKGDVFTFYQRLKDVDFPTALKEMAEMTGTSTDVKPKVVATFKYTDEAGNLLYVKERLEPGRNGRSKEFVFRHRDGNKWVMGRGCEPVLYRLPEITKSKYLFIVEGEGKADLLVSWGLVATCLDSGANSPFKDEYIQILGSMEKVIVLPDNDTPGKNYAHKIASELHGKVKVLKIIELPGLGEAQDIIDWARIAGNDKSRLIGIVKNTPEWTPNDLHSFTTPIYTRETVKLKISSLKDVLSYSRPEYLVEPFLYRNTSNLLTAYAGVGKSLISMSIVHAVITGQPLWDNFQVHQTGSVLIIDEENPGAFLRDRLVRMGFTEGMQLHFLHYQSVKLDDSRCFAELLEVIQQIKPVLVVFDALIRLHNAKENDNSEMAHVMGKIRDLINQTGITALTIHHDKKGAGDKKERARGGSDIVGAIDSQICLETKEDETLVLSPGKCRMMPFKPIKLKIDGAGDRLSFTYLGKDLSETEELTTEIVEIIGKETMGIEDIKKGLEAKGYDVGVNKLRNILKLATGKELLTGKGMRGRLTYSVNFQFHGHTQTTREGQTPDNNGTEASFTGYI